jgi:hypothetical protein
MSTKTSGHQSRDDNSNNVGLYGDARGGDDGQEDNVATPEVHQGGGDAQPLSNFRNRGVETRRKKEIVGPLRTFPETSTWAPIARGANVQSVRRPRASLRWHVWPQEARWTTAQDVKIMWENVETENRTVVRGEDPALCCSGQWSDTCPPLNQIQCFDLYVWRAWYSYSSPLSL